MFSHRLNLPSPKTLSNPALHGFPEFQVRNFYIENEQNNKLGVWQVIPTSAYWKEIHSNRKEFNDEFYNSFLTDNSTTTLIYLHGKFGNRGNPRRAFTYQKLASINNYNVIVLDYTGFGDSTGSPTEQNIISDSKTLWDWLIQRGASPERLIIMGHSMGTAVATKLTEQLLDQNILPKALILKSPFTDIQKAVFDQKLFGKVHFLGPIGHIPQLKGYLLKILKLEFNSLRIINKLKLPLLILHGTSDLVLPPSHSEDLFQAVTNSTDCKPIAQTSQQLMLKSVELKSSQCNQNLVQLAKFDHIGHSTYHRFDSVFKIIGDFEDSIIN
ncbi:alpha/beta-hydrolase [Conidiobolus coronatus NRRL 28638]|uniref:Alpha/beta-hydrolase n=1 Tax=Conidiobolus coronatus (strain ATCC 28846 / CBS 209.66 / NRRL 28638) TaxID=796925 RepID=A0A137PEU5_CONC2|nr:alpha/beta-hydrolase [Conidiobolus coronatus NRRL 28638]|eukprot:KXN73471.1 alpha/beta-hydrolase [Conidiobolus coronatus NRRL 28638]